MNRLKAIRACRVMALFPTLVGVMVTTLLLPAYGQQEMDPTWFDPWATPHPSVVVHSSARRAALH